MDVRMEKEKNILISCAPVLLHQKTGSTITLCGQERECFCLMMEEWDTPWELLSEDGSRSVFLLYRPERLVRCLSHGLNREFLSSLGYDLSSSYACIERLKRRFCDYTGCKRGFPHEIGVFLDYPVGDIQKFIENKGKNYLLCGYWKVYEEVELAKRRFEEYESAKKRMAAALDGINRFI